MEDYPCVPTISPRSIVPPSASTASSTCSTRRPRTAAPVIPPTTSSAPARTPTASASRSPAFRRASFRIVAKENTLTIKGEKTANENGKDNSEVLYRGIAARAFERVFQLADFVQVKDASLENGLLHVDLVREIPEAKKPRSIPINSGARPRRWSTPRSPRKRKSSFGRYWPNAKTPRETGAFFLVLSPDIANGRPSLRPVDEWRELRNHHLA